MKKEIRFSSIIDTKEFDRAVEDMQKKLTSVYQASDRSRAQLDVKQAVSRAGLGPAPTAADKARADQDDLRIRRGLDKFIKDQVKEQENLSRELKKQIEQRKELLKLSKDTAEIDKQIATTKEKQRASEEEAMRALRNRERPGYEGVGGIGGAFSRGQTAFERARRLGLSPIDAAKYGLTGFGRGVMGMNPAALGGLAGGGLASGGILLGNTLESFNLAERQALAAQGSARSAFAQPATGILSGQGVESMLYAGQTGEAMKRAKDEVTRTNRNDLIKLGGSALAVLAGAALTLTGIGAGAGVGLMAAGGAGLVSQYGQIESRVTGRYEAERLSQQTQAFQTNLESLKSLDPVKRAVFQRYQQELMPNLALQRATGFSDQELEERFRGGIGYGFSTGTTRTTMQEILAAGGSTRAAREGTVDAANLLKRNANLTNASSAIGRLSALTGDPSQATSTLVKLLAEGTQIGIDKSEFAEEQRKFVDISTEIISRSGALNENQKMVGEGFSRFLGPGQANMFNLRGAQGAYNLMQSITGESGGARGAIKAAALNRDPLLSTLDVSERNALMNLTEEQVRAGGPLMEGFAASASLKLKKQVSVKEIQDSILKVQGKSVGTRAEFDKYIQKMKELRAAGKQDSNEYRSYKGKAIAMIGETNPELIGQPLAADQLIEGMVTEKKGITPAQQQVKAGELIFKEPTRAGDKAEAAQAAADEAYLGTKKLFTGEFDTATENLKTFSKNIVAAAEALGKIDKDDMEGLQKAAQNLTELWQKIGAVPKGSALVDDTQSKGGPKSE